MRLSSDRVHVRPATIHTTLRTTMRRGAVLSMVLACTLLLTPNAPAQSSMSDLGSNFVATERINRSDVVTRPVPTRPMAPQSATQRERAALPWPPTNPDAQVEGQNPHLNKRPVHRRAQTGIAEAGVRPLPRPSEHPEPATGNGTTANLSIVGKSLALVLGMFFAALWVARRAGWKALPPSDGGVFHLLGEFPLAGRRKAMIVKFGQRLLVFADSTRGIEKLTEVTDPAEVEQVMAMCEPQFGGQRVSTLQDWMRSRSLQSGVTTELPGRVA